MAVCSARIDPGSKDTCIAKVGICITTRLVGRIVQSVLTQDPSGRALQGTCRAGLRRRDEGADHPGTVTRRITGWPGIGGNDDDIFLRKGPRDEGRPSGDVRRTAVIDGDAFVGARIDPGDANPDNTQPFIIAIDFEDYDCLC